MKAAGLLVTLLIFHQITFGCGFTSFTCSGDRCFGIGYYFASRVNFIADFHGTSLGECSAFCDKSNRKYDAATFDQYLVSAARPASSLN